MKKTIMALMATTFLMTAGAASAAINPVNIGESSSAENIYSVILDKVEAGETAGIQSGFAWAYVNGGFVSLSVNELRKHGANAGKFFSEYVGEKVLIDLKAEKEDALSSLEEAVYEAVMTGVDPALLSAAQAEAIVLQIELDQIEAAIAGHDDIVADLMDDLAEARADASAEWVLANAITTRQSDVDAEQDRVDALQGQIDDARADRDRDNGLAAGIEGRVTAEDMGADAFAMTVANIISRSTTPATPSVTVPAYTGATVDTAGVPERAHVPAVMGTREVPANVHYEQLGAGYFRAVVTDASGTERRYSGSVPGRASALASAEHGPHVTYMTESYEVTPAVEYRAATTVTTLGDYEFSVVLEDEDLITIQDAIDDAYDAGYTAGYEDGYADGYTVGFTDGVNSVANR